MNRRGFLRACLAAAVAPAVVQAGSIMRIKPLILPGDDDFIIASEDFMAEYSAIVRRVFVPRMVVQIYNTSPLMKALLANARAA